MFEFLYGFFLLFSYACEGLGWLLWQLLKGLYFVAKWTVIGIVFGIGGVVGFFMDLFERKPTQLEKEKMEKINEKMKELKPPPPPKPKPKTYFEQWFEYYEKRQWVDDVCKYISSDGLPLKIIINFGSVVAYHLGNRQVTYDFFGRGMESFENPSGVDYKDKTCKMYIAGCVINKKLGNCYSVQEKVKVTQYYDWIEEHNRFSTELQFVELTRPLQRL